MATTTAPATDRTKDRRSVAGVPQPEQPSGRGADGAVTPAEPAAAGRADATESAEQYPSLLGSPNYDQIVGGVPPSPYASLILLGGLLCLIGGAIGMAIGADVEQWWILGAMLIAIAVFLAGFVSRA